MRSLLYTILLAACCLNLPRTSMAQSPEPANTDKVEQSQEQPPNEHWTQILPGLDMQIIKQGKGDRQVVEDDIVNMVYNAKVKEIIYVFIFNSFFTCSYRINKIIKTTD